MQKLKAEMVRNRANNVTVVKSLELNPQQVKFAALGEELDELNLNLRKENGFV